MRGSIMTGKKSEIRKIRFLLEKIDSIIESRLIGFSDPEMDEVAEILDYEQNENRTLFELNQ